MNEWDFSIENLAVHLPCKVKIWVYYYKSTTSSSAALMNNMLLDQELNCSNLLQEPKKRWPSVLVTTQMSATIAVNLRMYLCSAQRPRAAPEPHWSHRQPLHSALATLEFCLIVNFIFSQRTPLSHSTSPGTRVSGEAAESFTVGNKLRVMQVSLLR